MLYEEAQLDSVLLCSKCHLKHDTPKCLPCGNIICQRCINDIQNLLDQIGHTEFHCQICSEFHEFPSSQSFPTCHQVATLLTKLPLEQKRTLPDIDKDLLSYVVVNDLENKEIKIRREFCGHTDSVYSVVALPDNRIGSGSCDGTIKIWNTDTGVLEKTLSFHSSSVNSLAYLSTNKIVSGSWDNTIKISAITTGQLLQTLTGHTGVVYSLVPLDNGQIVSGSIDGSIKIWYTNSVKKSDPLRMSLAGHTDGVYSLAVIGNKQEKLASGFLDGIKIWCLNTGQLIRTITGHTSAVSALVGLSDTEFVSGSWDETIKVWEISTGKLKRTLTGHTNEVHCVSKLSNGDLVSCSMDGSIKVWNSLSGFVIRTMEYEASAVYSLSVMADGKVVSGWEDNIVRILEV